MNNYTTNINAPKKSTGTFLSLVLVFFIVVISGAWYWYSELYTPPTIVLPEPLTAFTTPSNDASSNTNLSTQHTTTLSESNTITDISTDITNTDLGSLETELLAIDDEIAAATKAIE